MTDVISTLFDTLNRAPSREAALSAFCASAMPMELLFKHMSFSDERYKRNVILTNMNFELVLICWKSSQKSSIHDHGSSVCAFKCMHGRLTERRYSSSYVDAERSPYCSESSIQPGDYSIALEGSGPHQIINSFEASASSVHVYMPPLIQPSQFKNSNYCNLVS